MSQTAKTTGAAGGNAKPDGATSGAATANKGRGGYGRGHSRPPRTSKAAFKGATEGLEALIYDDGPGSESKFVRNQESLAEHAARKCQRHAPSNAVDEELRRSTGI